jgi:hypothetical protein
MNKSYLLLGIMLLIALFSVQNLQAQGYAFSATSGSFTALSGGTTMALTGGTVDDGWYNAIPIGFTFKYWGVDYTTTAASTNGFLTPGATLTTAYATNNLSTNAVRPVIAPLWDDLDIQFATNFSYKTEGSEGSRVFTAEWLNEQWYYSASGNTISFQVKLYEGTNAIQFIYRQETGTATAASASIGLAGPGSFVFVSLDGTGTSPNASWTTETTNLTTTKPATGQTYTFTPPTTPLNGNYTIKTSGGSYNSFSSAFKDLASIGVSGITTFDVDPGFTSTELCPALWVNSTSSNTVTFQKNGEGTNPKITAGTGIGSTDAIIKIAGADYVSFLGIDLAENSGNTTTTTQMEYGYYLYNASAIDGAQYVTINNSKITLNRANTSTRALYQNALITPTNATGANSYNNFQSVTIENAYQGIYVAGNSTYPSLAMEVSACIIGAATANDIGNGSSTLNGIRMTSVSGASVFGNEVRNVTVTGAAAVYGIYLESIQGTNNIYGNNIHDIKSTSTSTSSIIYGIRTDINATHSCNVYNNFVSALSHGITSATATQVIRGITVGLSGTGTGNFHFNSVRIDEDQFPSSTAFYIGTGGTVNAKNNIFANNSTAGATSLRYCVFKATGSTLSGVDYNNYYINTAGTGNNVGSYNATNYNTVALWNTATGKDANTKNANPLFASTTNLHSSSSDMNGAGVTISTGNGDALNITTDIDGATRGTPPDMGADEFDINDETSRVVAPGSQISGNTIASTVTTIGEAVDVFSFTVLDRGTGDGLATKVTNVRIQNAEPGDGASWTAIIGGVKLNDGSNDITIGTPTITASYIDIPITAGNLDVEDGAELTLTMSLYLKTSGIQDGKKLQFTISPTDHNWAADGSGSLFAADFGDAITSEEFTLDVTATKLLFSGVPANVLVNMNFGATVNAVDANGNVDVDNTSSVTLARNSGTGTFSSTSGLTQSLVLGTKSWTDLRYDAMQTFTLQANGGSLTQGVSGSIVCSNIVTIGSGALSQSYPFDVYYGYSRNAALYTQAEIGGYFSIDQLGWQVATPQAAINCPIKVYLKKTTATTITADTWANMISGAETVYEGTLQFSPTGWYNIVFTNSFDYDADNLLVLTEGNYTGGGTSTYPTFYYSTATSMNANQRADTNPPITNLTVGSSRPNLRMTLPVPKVLSGITYNQASTNPAPVGAIDMAILRLDFAVTGTIGELNLNSIEVTSNNTDDADIANVKLYRTSNTTFNTTNLLGEANFSGGIATFSDLRYDLPAGNTYFWVAYDISESAANNNLADAKIAINGIDVGDVTYPDSEQSPAGSRTIRASLAGNYEIGSSKYESILMTEYNLDKAIRRVQKEVVEYVSESSTARSNSITSDKSGKAVMQADPANLKLVATKRIVAVDVPYYTSRNTGKEFNAPKKVSLSPELAAKYGIRDDVSGVYPTITAAVADLNTLGVSAAVTFTLTDATYNTTSGETFPILITPVIGGSATKTVTIKPKALNTATITGSSTTGIIVLNGCDYVTIDGSNSGGSDRNLIIENTNTSATTYVVGVFNNGGTDGAKNCTIKNTEIKATGEVTNTQWGIILNASGGDYDNIVIDNNRIHKCRTGIQFSGVTGSISNDGQITNNIIGDATTPITYIGIVVAYADNTLISGNEIFGNPAGNTNYYQSGVSLGAGSTSSKIRKNKIHDFYYTGTTGYGCYGIYYAGEATSVTEISNNMIYAIKGGGDPGQIVYNPAGIYLSAGGNIQIYNNSIYMSGDVLGAGTYNGYGSCITLTATITALDIRNNALRNSMGRISGGTTSPLAYVFYSGSANTAYSNINNNAYYYTDQANVTEHLGYLGSARTDLAAWQTATAQDGNSAFGDPKFTSASVLHVLTDAATCLEGGGVRIAGITNDIDGDLRFGESGYAGNGSAPDIGADEFNGLSLLAAPEAAAATAVSHEGFTARWGAVSGATSYRLSVFQGGVAIDGYDNLTCTTNLVRVSELVASTAYTYKVIAVNATFASSYSDIIHVSTTAVTSGTSANTAIGGASTEVIVPPLSGFTDNTVIIDPASETDDDIAVAVSGDAALLTYSFTCANNAALNGTYILNHAGLTVIPTISINSGSFEIIEQSISSSTILISGFGAKGTLEITLQGDEPLPIVLSSFSAVLNSQNNVNILWITQTETNLTGFYIYRSTESNVNNAVSVSALINPTNSSQQHSYVFTDNSLEESGLYYYWLQTAELDGTTMFHGPTSINYSAQQDPGTPEVPLFTELLNAFPNPFNPNTSLRYSLKEAGKVNIDIYNMKGQIVRSFNAEHNTPGYYSMTWDGCDASGKTVGSGVYMYRMTSGKYSAAKKMILSK